MRCCDFFTDLCGTLRFQNRLKTNHEKYAEKLCDPGVVRMGGWPLTHADGGEQGGLTEGAWRHGD